MRRIASLNGLNASQDDSLAPRMQMNPGPEPDPTGWSPMS